MNSQIQSLLDELVATGDERGLQVAAYVNGELVLDAWSGVADINQGNAVEADTLFPVFSVTKGMASTAVHLLAERGQLDYDQPIADVWPEFAAQGKNNITIRHAMSHMAGLAHMPANLTHQNLGDWDFMTAAIADLKPAHPPTEQIIYHAMTFGWIMGEIVRRIDGRDFPQFLKEELNAPLGIDSLFASIPDEVESRVAWLEEDVAESHAMPENLGNESVPAWIRPLHTWMNRDDARRACIPASSGIMNARAMAKHYASLLPGGVDGVELLPPERVRIATEPQRTNQPESSLRPSLGYQLGGGDSIYGPNIRSFGHGGYGGSIAFADPVNHVAFALCKNRFNAEGNTMKVIKAFRELLQA